jgi:hypothetical protein
VSMNERPAPLLTIHFEGPSVQGGRILLDDLIQFVSNIGAAVERIVNVMETGVGARVGRPPKLIQLQAALEVVALSPGSVELALDLRREQPLLPDFDVGLLAVEKLIVGLPNLTESDEPLPEGFDEGVLTSLREAGRILDKGFNSVSLALPPRPGPRTAVMAAPTRDVVISRLRRFQQAWATVEGRLLMADVQENILRCRLHPSTGSPILCEFPESLSATVMKYLRRFVQARGEATIERATNQVRRLNVLDLEPIDEPSLAGIQVPSTSFWQAQSFEDLAEEQGVYPLTDWSQLQGDWPEGADFDEFLDAILELRRS